jgi:hypothetical protein
MTALTAATAKTAVNARTTSDVDTQANANAWIAEHHDRLVRLLHAQFTRQRAEARGEAVAETLALIAGAVHRAAAAGTLEQITVSSCVRFAVRQYRCGRRAAGTSSRDPLAHAAKVRHGICVYSLDGQIPLVDRRRRRQLQEALATGESESPLEITRRGHDYPLLLNEVSDKAQRTFGFLAATHGAGRQVDLAAELMVSPARITQLKAELATALGAGGYAGPLGARPA